MEKSYQLAADFKTQYWLARCKTTIGHLASASRIYRELIDELGKRAGDASRAASDVEDDRKRIQVARDELAQIEGDVAKITVQLGAAVKAIAGLRVRHNGEGIPITALDQPLSVDPGTHTIEVSASGFISWSMVKELSNGGHHTVSLAKLDRRDTARVVINQGPRLQRIFGWVTGGIGLAGLIAGGAVAIVAKLEYDRSSSGCDDQGCNQASRDQQRQARLKGDVATGLLIGGAAFATGGLVLLLTAPQEKGEQKKTERSKSAELSLRAYPLGGAMRLTW
jgi:hypothetical protein